MPDRSRLSTRPDLAAGAPLDSELLPSVAAAALSPDQIRRWADRIADGHGQVPEDLGVADRDRLEAEVRQRLRDRLVRHIARVLAVTIQREASQRQEDATDA